MHQPGANDDILSPVTFLNRSAVVYPHRVAVVDGEQHYTYLQFQQRVHRLANALHGRGIGRDDKVVFICPNTLPLLEAHFAVPMLGAVLVAINTDFSQTQLSHVVNHSDARVVFVDSEFAGKFLAIRNELEKVELVVDIADVTAMPNHFDIDYESLMAEGGTEAPAADGLVDENQLIAINYTSGTTGCPKGVMYSHRSSCLHTLGEIIQSGLTADSVYLWTLPMFHCNGWSFPWAIAAVGGTQVCMRHCRPADIIDLIEQEQVTHLSAAPTVLQMMVEYPASRRVKLRRPLQVITAGATPTPAVTKGMEEIGANVVHVYGLTELHGPHSVCTWQSEWVELDPDKLSRLKSRQGVPYILSQHMEVVDSATMEPVPRDGVSIGEVVMRGHNVMLGYYKDPEATAVAFRDGWFHSGDLGVVHPDGYIQIMDRARDVIRRGDKHIPSLEIESLLTEHPEVMEAAVVAVPDPELGEVPKAFVALRQGGFATAEELIEFCRTRQRPEMVPVAVEFQTLPKTATGKTQKSVLRRGEWQKGEERPEQVLQG